MAEGVDASIKKALESALYNTLVTVGFVNGAGKPKVQWPNKRFDPATVEEYIRYQHFQNPPVPGELGPNPRMGVKGFIAADVFIRRGIGEDRADVIAGYVRQAYPYAAPLVRNGIQVNIDIIEVKPGAESGSWWQVNITVQWAVWRTNT